VLAGFFFVHPILHPKNIPSERRQRSSGVNTKAISHPWHKILFPTVTSVETRQMVCKVQSLLFCTAYSAHTVNCEKA